MQNPISDCPSSEKEIKRLEKKLRKASEKSGSDINEQGTYYGLNRIKEKKVASGFWKFIVLIIFILLIVLCIWLLSGIISGKIDVFGIFKELNKN